MTRPQTGKRSPLRRKAGVTIVSYGLLVGLIGVVALVATTQIGDNTRALFTEVGDSLTDVTGETTGSDPDPVPTSPTPTPTPINITARYWRLQTIGTGHGGQLNSATELIMRQDNSWSTFPGASLESNNSTSCTGNLSSLNNSVATINNTGFYACAQWDFVVDFGSPINVSGLGLLPQGNNPNFNSDDSGAECFNVPVTINIWGSNSNTGWSSSPDAVVSIPGPTDSSGCQPDGVYPGAGNSYMQEF